MHSVNNQVKLAITGWNVYPWLRAGWSTRSGGLSHAFGGEALNLGWRPDDEDSNVLGNRERFATAVWGDEPPTKASLVTVRQVHSDQIQVIRKGEGPFATGEGRAVLEGDGMVTGDPGLLLAIQVADCVPVLVADVRRRAVGAFHAGWRGTLAHIAAKGVRLLEETYNSDPRDLVAAIGPSIGPCCYAVGDEVVESFRHKVPQAVDLFSAPPGRAGGLHLDLWEANRRQLVEAGVPASAIRVLGECSACMGTPTGQRKYFSHRADQGRTGRLMGAIGVIP